MSLLTGRAMLDNQYVKVAVILFRCAIATSLLVHILSWALWSPSLFYLQSFSVWAHQCGQALAGYVLGYNMQSISLLKLAGGLKEWWPNSAEWKQFIFASAGPMSTMMVFLLLIIGSSFLLRRCWLLCLVFIVPCIITLPLMGTQTDFIIVGGYTLVLFFLLMVGPWQAIYFVLQFIGFGMLIDVIVYGLIIPLFIDCLWPFCEILRSDEMLMGQITHLPCWVWKALFSTIQFLLGTYSLKVSLWVLRTKGTVLSLMPIGQADITQ